MNLKVVGGILMILGTSVGAGILALPIAAAQEGFAMAVILLFFTWALMTLGAFAVLEVNLWLPKNSNLVSMAGATIGPIGQIVTWLSCLLLLYALVCAYISGNSDVLQSVLATAHLHLPRWLDTMLIVFVFGGIISFGIYSVDMVNRVLMGSKIIIYVLLVILAAPHIKIFQLTSMYSKTSVSAVMVMVTSFGFATIIPSLRSYFDSDVRKLRLIILIGSLIPLAFYIAWFAVVKGVLTAHQLDALAQTNQPIGGLLSALDAHFASNWASSFAHIFASICAATSFLGVALSLSDFLADGLHIRKQGKSGILIYMIEFIPPLLIVLWLPGIFITALNYAGITCVVLLMLLPLLMVWRGRYHKKMQAEYKFWGGRWLLFAGMAMAVVLLLWNLMDLLKLVK